MAQSEPESDGEPENTVECPTCESEVPESKMDGNECLTCSHVRADARDAKRAAEQEAARHE